MRRTIFGVTDDSRAWAVRWYGTPFARVTLTGPIPSDRQPQMRIGTTTIALHVPDGVDAFVDITEEVRHG